MAGVLVMSGQAVLLVLIGMLLALILLPILAMGLMMGGMMGMSGMMGQGGMGGMMGWPAPGWLMLAFWLLIVVGLVLLLVWGVRRAGGPRQDAAGEPPLTALQRRYARGEIDAEEYERIRDELLREHGRA